MSRLLPLLLVCALVPACKNKDKDKDTDTPATTPEDEDSSFAVDGSDANAADTDAQLVASSLVAASPGTIGLASLDEGALGAQDVGDGVKAIYLPRSCVTGRQTAPGEATYTFDKCIGPNGLLGVSGEIKARFTADATKLHLDLTYTNMKVNGAKFDGSATAEVTAAGAKRTMSWGATLDGETQHGKPFSYRSTHTVGWSLGEACFSLEGTTEGQVRQRDIKTEVQSFRRCRRGCPEDGGKIIVTNVAKNKVVTIEFDGTATATYTAPNGKQLPLALACKE